ncbi:MAG: helix-turn-helix domain-containing protein, partial [Pigmentiphaga sp.]
MTASASPEGPDQSAKYKVQSLERGLLLLRELRAANAPLRNQELVSRTGLPKATVSRLLSTLGALGYVRRSDGGSYVLAQGSSRSGQAMLGALDLEGYHGLFLKAPGTVYLEALVGGALLPVYRWSALCHGTLTHGAASPSGLTQRRSTTTEGSDWDAAAETWWAWLAVDLGAVGAFVLTSR